MVRPRATLAEVRGLLSSGGVFAFPTDLAADGEDTLMRHPVSTSSAMPADGVASALPIALVDLSRYRIATHNMLSLRVLSETYAGRYAPGRSAAPGPCRGRTVDRRGCARWPGVAPMRPLAEHSRLLGAKPATTSGRSREDSGRVAFPPGSSPMSHLAARAWRPLRLPAGRVPHPRGKVVGDW